MQQHVVREQAAKVQDALIKITTQAPTTSAPAPKPARPVRALVGRCLDILLARTESRTLFDCIHLLSKAIADPKVDKDNKMCVKATSSRRRADLWLALVLRCIAPAMSCFLTASRYPVASRPIES